MGNLLKTLLLLGLAGSAGALSRFAISGLVQHWCGARFPWATLVVNAAGCFLFGLIWPLAEERSVITGQFRFILLTGFMGSFTTFSTYAFDTCRLAEDAQWLPAIANVGAQNTFGLCGLLAGLATARWLSGTL